MNTRPSLASRVTPAAWLPPALPRTVRRWLDTLPMGAPCRAKVEAVFLRIASFLSSGTIQSLKDEGSTTGPGGTAVEPAGKGKESLDLGFCLQWDPDGDPGFSSDTPFNDEFIAEEQERCQMVSCLSQLQVRTDPIWVVCLVGLQGL